MRLNQSIWKIKYSQPPLTPQPPMHLMLQSVLRRGGCIANCPSHSLLGFCVWPLSCCEIFIVISSFAIIPLVSGDSWELYSECLLNVTSVDFPHGTMACCAVCDCHMSWSYSLTFGSRREKPVFGNSDKVRFKPACSTTETS